ncbi:hypothetical protein [Williamsia deligens]|uniref:Integral membrane protein n=1 Tax=Williamsia deligens TaxID=321325 RepID=A0ABW3G4S4_9NOCA|nr:hypothetical protein [Williamsia deligens]MCP2193980.1 hypothetical protein [Williamsia deligens]
MTAGVVRPSRTPTDIPSWTRALPFLVAVVATVALVVASPTLGDLQAAIAREEAARSGVGLGYWFGWYGGVSPGSYSLIVPALSALTGSLVLLAIATLVIAALAHPLAHLRPGATSGPLAARPTLTTWAIVVAAVLNMMSGRVAFAVGAAIALIAVLAAGHGRSGVAAAVLVVSGLASPLAPAFVGLAAVPFLLGPARRSRDLWTLLGGAALGVLIPFALFGAPGAQGFPWTTLFWVVLIGIGAGVALTSAPQRWISPVAVAVAIVVFAVPNGVGSNLSRFFCLVLPCLVLFFSRRSLVIVLVAITPAVAYAGFVAVADQVAVADSGNSESDYAPLRLALLSGPGLINHRVELIDAGTHAGSHELGSLVKLARGWENQSDARFNPIFYDEGALTPLSYRRWLTENAVSWVALSGKPLRQGMKEAALVRSGLPYLTRAWAGGGWTLYRVANATAVVPEPLRLVTETPSEVVVDVPDTGSHPIQIRPNRYLVARSLDDPTRTACLSSTADGWVSLRAPVPGRYTLQGALSVRGVLAELSPTCGS